MVFESRPEIKNRVSIAPARGDRGSDPPEKHKKKKEALDGPVSRLCWIRDHFEYQLGRLLGLQMRPESQCEALWALGVLLSEAWKNDPKKIRGIAGRRLVFP